MIKVPSKTFSVRQEKLVSSAIRTTNKTVGSGSTASTETASLGGGGAVNVSGIGMNQRGNLDTMLLGFINDKQQKTLNTLYRDIYNYDAVSGSFVDFAATLPFSDLYLTGCDDKELEVYASSIERLGLKNNHAFIRANEMIFGEFISTLVYNDKEKNFVDMIPHSLDHCTIKYSPLTSVDPIITATLSEELREFLSSDEDTIRKLRRHIPQRLINNMLEGDFMLDPLSTLYLGRFTFDRTQPTSVYRRVLPIYLLEKILTRGTLANANRRISSILHVAAGESGVWEPNEDEISALLRIFQLADLDPVNAMVVTRNGVQVNEFRDSQNFWKITDIYDQTRQMKLNALGTSDSFMSGDTNYSTAEVNMTVYLENLKYERDNFTQRLYYNKLFPIIAAANKFKHDDHSIKTGTSLHYKVRDASQYKIPRVHWRKSLEPTNDAQAIEMLNYLNEKGVPISLRMYAAAAGMSIEQIEAELEDDIEQRKYFAEYQTKLEKELGVGDEGDEDDDYGEYASIKNKGLVKPKILRDFGELAEVYDTDPVSGKKRLVANQTRRNKMVNDIAAEVLRNLSDPNHYAKVAKKAHTKGLTQLSRALRG